MSRTTQRQYSAPDGWHVGRRLERQARPAGRMLAILLAEELADGTREDDVVMDVAADEARFNAEPWDGPDGYNSDCGCYCRRCLLHGDCGGCVAPGGHTFELVG